MRRTGPAGARRGGRGSAFDADRDQGEGVARQRGGSEATVEGDEEIAARDEDGAGAGNPEERRRRKKETERAAHRVERQDPASLTEEQAERNPYRPFFFPPLPLLWFLCFLCFGHFAATAGLVS